MNRSDELLEKMYSENRSFQREMWELVNDQKKEIKRLNSQVERLNSQVELMGRMLMMMGQQMGLTQQQPTASTQGPTMDEIVAAGKSKNSAPLE